MKRKAFSYQPQNINEFKQKILNWGKQFQEICFLESNTEKQIQKSLVHKYDSIIAIGSINSIVSNYNKAFEKLNNFIAESNDWIFGNLAYDLKNGLEAIASENIDNIDFPELYFFIPKYIFIQKGNFIELQSFNDYDYDIFQIIENTIIEKLNYSHKIVLKPRVSVNKYRRTFDKIIEEIKAGNIYEMNYCFEFFAEDVNLNPVQVWEKLNGLTAAPMACFYKLNSKYLLCASPERFLLKDNLNIIAQPIKGTSKRSENNVEDEKLKIELKRNIKEQTENVMIVDLVRNDLSKIAKPSSVKVDELFGVYTFKQVHQLISTISCVAQDNICVSKILKENFPMGSMTGAPKVSAMQLIELFETTKRGLYSGSVGYIDPTGNFDFNVVIRSIIYDENKKYLSYSVGSAITFSANAHHEYDECFLKAKVIEELLH